MDRSFIAAIALVLILASTVSAICSSEPETFCEYCVNTTESGCNEDFFKPTMGDYSIGGMSIQPDSETIVNYQNIYWSTSANPPTGWRTRAKVFFCEGGSAGCGNFKHATWGDPDIFKSGSNGGECSFDAGCTSGCTGPCDYPYIYTGYGQSPSNMYMNIDLTGYKYAEIEVWPGATDACGSPNPHTDFYWNGVIQAQYFYTDGIGWGTYRGPYNVSSWTGQNKQFRVLMDAKNGCACGCGAHLAGVRILASQCLTNADCTGGTVCDYNFNCNYPSQINIQNPTPNDGFKQMCVNNTCNFIGNFTFNSTTPLQQVIWQLKEVRTNATYTNNLNFANIKGFWGFNNIAVLGENNTYMRDQGLTGNNATVTNATFVQGRNGNALRISGTNTGSGAWIPYTSSLNLLPPYTISWWMGNLGSNPTDRVLMGEGMRAGEWAIVYKDTTGLGLYTNQTRTALLADAPFNTSIFNNFILTVDSSRNFRLFLNGVLANNGTIPLYTQTASSQYGIGNGYNQSGALAPLIADIDDLMYQNVNVNDSSAKELYQNAMSKIDIANATWAFAQNEATVPNGNYTYTLNVNNNVWTNLSARVITFVAPGQACSSSPECGQGYCADSVCCWSACGGTCQACDVPGSVGNCTFVPNGNDMDNECTSDGSSTFGCGTGNCNGAGACGYVSSGENNCPNCQTCDGTSSPSCVFYNNIKDSQGNRTCTGLCQGCFSGSCQNVPNGQNTFGECFSANASIDFGCSTGSCNGAGACGNSFIGGGQGLCPTCYTCTGSTNATCLPMTATKDTEGSNTCTGTCRGCQAGNCTLESAGQDWFGECPALATTLNGCSTGSCSGTGTSCGYYNSGEQLCPNCQTCDGATSMACTLYNGVRDTQGSQTCTGQCTICNSGTCGYESSTQDIYGECPSGPCVTGFCAGGNTTTCGVYQAGEEGNCGGPCMECNAPAGSCIPMLNATQDNNGRTLCNGECQTCSYVNATYSKCIAQDDTDYFNQCNFDYSGATPSIGCGTGICDGVAKKCGFQDRGEWGCPSCQTCENATSASCVNIPANYVDDQGIPHVFRDNQGNRTCVGKCMECSGGSCIPENTVEDYFNDCPNGNRTYEPCTSGYCSGEAADIYGNSTCGYFPSGQEGYCGAPCLQCNAGHTCETIANGQSDFIGNNTCLQCEWCQSGACADVPSGQDPFNRCGDTGPMGCGTGTCGGDGYCGFITTPNANETDVHLLTGNCAPCNGCYNATSQYCVPQPYGTLDFGPNNHTCTGFCESCLRVVSTDNLNNVSVPQGQCGPQPAGWDLMNDCANPYDPAQALAYWNTTDLTKLGCITGACDGNRQCGVISSGDGYSPVCWTCNGRAQNATACQNCDENVTCLEANQCTPRTKRQTDNPRRDWFDPGFAQIMDNTGPLTCTGCMYCNVTTPDVQAQCDNVPYGQDYFAVCSKGYWEWDMYGIGWGCTKNQCRGDGVCDYYTDGKHGCGQPWEYHYWPNQCPNTGIISQTYGNWSCQGTTGVGCNNNPYEQNYTCCPQNQQGWCTVGCEKSVYTNQISCELAGYTWNTRDNDCITTTGDGDCPACQTCGADTVRGIGASKYCVEKRNMTSQGNVFRDLDGPNTCTDTCMKCEGGSCRPESSSQDGWNECPWALCATGYCSGSGPACGLYGPGQEGNCGDYCKVCDDWGVNGTCVPQVTNTSASIYQFDHEGAHQCDKCSYCIGYNSTKSTCAQQNNTDWMEECVPMNNTASGCGVGVLGEYGSCNAATHDCNFYNFGERLCPQPCWTCTNATSPACVPLTNKKDTEGPTTCTAACNACQADSNAPFGLACKAQDNTDYAAECPVTGPCSTGMCTLSGACGFFANNTKNTCPTCQKCNGNSSICVPEPFTFKDVCPDCQYCGSGTGACAPMPYGGVDNTSSYRDDRTGLTIQGPCSEACQQCNGAGACTLLAAGAKIRANPSAYYTQCNTCQQCTGTNETCGFFAFGTSDGTCNAATCSQCSGTGSCVGNGDSSCGGGPAPQPEPITPKEPAFNFQQGNWGTWEQVRNQWCVGGPCHPSWYENQHCDYAGCTYVPPICTTCDDPYNPPDPVPDYPLLPDEKKCVDGYILDGTVCKRTAKCEEGTFAFVNTQGNVACCPEAYHLVDRNCQKCGAGYVEFQGECVENSNMFTLLALLAGGGGLLLLL